MVSNGDSMSHHIKLVETCRGCDCYKVVWLLRLEGSLQEDSAIMAVFVDALCWLEFSPLESIC